ncbi:spermatogenesis-associated protein 6 isoform X2 [Apis mellifera]|uniref:Spermatogenesis-associated protein 6 isoform X2 n=1 Tax=Apis mellifera TaxID=7460 RepID=A0A7M7GNW3_APIME|nr:spermatogenesis-associated protein 6 isoform X2 [Apis mellifera]|eukprot:XP_006557770.1 spermatogenesis-associated protein 6 isoform X2 [Apis mellifera]
MAGKGFCVKVKLELHAITCPGVWLCPNGEIALRITSLGSVLESHRVSPIFPLLFHNEFNFKKTFTRLAALTELQRILEKQPFYAELIQWLNPCNRPIILATFHTTLADLLYPVAQCKRLLPGVDIDLLMDPTKYFPGIIAPKIEISTKTVIEEVKTIYCSNVDQSCVLNPKTINSKQKSYTHKKRAVKGIIRQRKVCHSRAKAKNQVCYPECDGTSPDKSIPTNLYNCQHYGCHNCLPNSQLSREPISTVPGLAFSAKDSKSNV